MLNNAKPGARLPSVAGFDSASVVIDFQLHDIVSAFEMNRNRSGNGMPDRVSNGLLSDTVHVHRNPVILNPNRFRADEASGYAISVFGAPGEVLECHHQSFGIDRHGDEAFRQISKLAIRLCDAGRDSGGSQFLPGQFWCCQRIGQVLR